MKWLLFFFLFIPVLASSQSPDSLRDNIWIFGYNHFMSAPDDYLHIVFDFSSDSSVYSLQAHQTFSINNTNISMCKRNGDLDFYSNMCHFANGAHEPILDGTVLNFSNTYEFFCDPILYFPGANYTRYFLVLPGTDTCLYHFFYHNVKLLGLDGAEATKLQYAQLNTCSGFSFDTLNQVLKEDEVQHFVVSHLSACRHGNGKDWWVLTPQETTNTYTKLLLSKDSIVSVEEQDIGAVYSETNDSARGNSVFSPDGTKFVDYAAISDLKIFDFDRCSGMLSNPIHIPIADESDTNGSCGVAISKNSRFVYCMSFDTIYQFDLWASDIAASKINVAVYDGFITQFNEKTYFYQGQLAPDGKIYVTLPGGKTAMHVIESPDSLGLACNVQQHKYLFPVAISGGMPNFPDFRLSTWVDSPCDTIQETSSVELLPKKSNILSIHPNPVTNQQVQFYTSQLDAVYQIYNIHGQLIQEGASAEGVHSIDVHRLESGVYILTIFNDTTRQSAKFVIQH